MKAKGKAGIPRRVAWYSAVLFTRRGTGVARRGSYLSENCQFLVPESKEFIRARCSACEIGPTRSHGLVCIFTQIVLKQY